MLLENKRYRLTDIADVQRAQKGVIYPKYTTYIQVSATQGQVHQLNKAGTIETKYATIIPKIDIFMPYFKIALERCVPEFLARYQSTINIQMGDFSFFEIDLHSDMQTQMEIVMIMDQCDRAKKVEQDIVDELKAGKKIALRKMMC